MRPTRFSVLATALILFALPLLAQDSTTRRPLANNPELEQLYRDDQAERTGGKKPGPDAPQRDQERLRRVAAIVDAGTAQTGDDYFHAAQVYNHGAAPEELLRGHVLAVLAAAKGNVQARFLSAASLDRYLRETGRAQVFGTQYTMQGSTATMGLYDRSMSDALRAEFDVPSLKEQEARLAELNKRIKP
jgi:hypothetical protein